MNNSRNKIEPYIRTISYLMRRIKTGKENGITRRKFYQIYVSEGGVLGFDNFDRQLRKLTEEARRKGFRVVGDNAGLYLASDDEEWNQYMSKARSRIESELKTFASCNGNTVPQQIKAWFFQPNKKNNPMKGEASLFDEVQNQSVA